MSQSSSLASTPQGKLIIFCCLQRKGRCFQILFQSLWTVSFCSFQFVSLSNGSHFESNSMGSEWQESGLPLKMKGSGGYLYRKIIPLVDNLQLFLLPSLALIHKFPFLSLGFLMSNLLLLYYSGVSGDGGSGGVGPWPTRF